jgi:hypothetical protein
MNLCTACGEDFGSLEAFDAHRVGSYPQRGPSEFIGSIEEWTPEKGRRCLTVEEMESGSFRGRQFVRNGRGRWSLERRLDRSRERFSVELPSPEGQIQHQSETASGGTRRRARSRELVDASR